MPSPAPSPPPAAGAPRRPQGAAVTLIGPAATPPTPALPMRETVTSFLRRLGHISILFYRSIFVLFQRPLEHREVVAQMELIGVKSTGLVAITGLFVGMVMALQFAIGLQKFGGMEYTGRVVALSFSRELAPTLTAVIVGGRIGAGVAAELGSMSVTEQIDAIRALGSDPIKKLVMPRLVATTIVMPVLSMFSLVIGFFGAMVVSSLQFGIPMSFFYHSALDSVTMNDFLNGFLKTPVFGALIALVGCHFGLDTSGGTQGVGRATTYAVVVISVSVLVTDYFLTAFFSFLLPR
ncbi:MAG TPA: ABC transporter permease [Polyangiaceae bacterium]|nr:ABC transporter permease [Polyangiaceae bacterium]